MRRQTAVALAGVAAEAEGLQVADGKGPLVFMGAAALAAAPCSCEHPNLHRAADRAAVAAAVGKHLFAALLAEGIEALAAQLLQRVALGVTDLIAADQAVGAYPNGAAWRIAAAQRETADVSSFLAAFLSTQHQAEPLASPEQAADAEYRYRVQLLPGTDPHLEVQCWRRMPGGGSWIHRCRPMPLAAFIQRFIPGDQL